MTQIETFLLLLGWISLGAGIMAYGLKPWAAGWVYTLGLLIIVIPTLLAVLWKIAGSVVS